jgi:hypothetical protein
LDETVGLMYEMLFGAIFGVLFSKNGITLALDF